MMAKARRFLACLVRPFFLVEAKARRFLAFLVGFLFLVEAKARRFLVGSFFLVLTGLTIAGFASRTWQPEAASMHGAGVDHVITYLLWSTGAILVVGHVALALLIWRGTSANPAPYKALSPRREWALAIAPAILMAVIAEVGVLAIGLPVWADVYGDIPAGALEVEAVGKQFEWIVRYPGKDGTFGKVIPEKIHDVRNPLGLDKKDPAATDDIVVRGLMHLPHGRRVAVRIRSHDVLHSFSIPQFRTKQDAVPGFATGTQFTPSAIGKFEIACAELCGMGHYRMRAYAVVLAPGEFDSWLSPQRGWFEKKK